MPYFRLFKEKYRLVIMLTMKSRNKITQVVGAVPLMR